MRSLSRSQAEASTWDLLLIVALGLALARAFDLLVAAFTPPVSMGGDFFAFFDAAQRVARREALYQLSPPPGAPGTYIYPPPLAIALAPFAGMSAVVAQRAFTGLSIAALLGCVWVVGSLASTRRAVAAGLVGAIALGSWPVHFLLRQGQVDALTLVLMMLALLFAHRRRDHVAALLLAVAISIKMTPAVLVGYFLWKRRYRLAAESTLAALALIAAGFLVIGLDSAVLYTTRVLPALGAGGDAYWYNQSLHATLNRLFVENRFTTPLVDLGMGFVVVAALFLTISLLALTFACVSRGWPTSGSLLLIEAGAFVAVETLATSRSYHMHMVWLLLPLAGLVLLILEGSRASRLVTVLVGLAAFGFVFGPLGPPFEYGRFGSGILSLVISHTTLAALLILGLCLAQSLASRRTGAGALAPEPAEPRTLAATARP